MPFDTEVFLEKIEETKPIVIFVCDGVIENLYIPEGEGTPSHLIIDCGEDDEYSSTDHDTFVEILESVGYIPSESVTYTDFVCDTTESNDGCILDED